MAKFRQSGFTEFLNNIWPEKTPSFAGPLWRIYFKKLVLLNLDLAFYHSLKIFNFQDIYNGDALLRFCPHKYYPFDSADRDKYVVHDDYRPTWEVPTLARLYSDLGFTFKETLNSHIRSLGKDPQKLWSDIEDVIRFVLPERGRS